MNKVLIVDDEPMIREGLATIIDWGKHGFEIADTAANGREAVEKYKQLKPALMLIDIRMPGMDGLEAIRQIREFDQESHILILSGYADFTYAKQAIAHHVNGYLLKPIDEVELETYAKDIAKQLAMRSEQNEESVQATEIIREELLQRIAVGKLEKDDYSLHRLTELLGPPARCFQLLLLELYSREHSLTRNAVMRQKLARDIEEKGHGWVFACEPYIGILLKDYPLTPMAMEQLHKLIDSSRPDSARFIAAASAPVEGFEQLLQWPHLLREQLKRRFLLAGNHIYMTELKQLPHEPDAKQAEQGGELDINTLAQSLYYRLEVGNSDGIQEALQQASAAIIATDDREQAIKSNWAQLLTIVLNKASVSNPELSLQEDLKIVTMLFLAHHYEEMLEQLQQMLGELAVKLRQSDNSSTMKQLTDFIERHYSENLKLETLSDIFNYNSGYLGKMFKSYTGESFNTYLDQVRIKHAIELLQSGMKVHQVSARVGYSNVDYFHSKFKKYKGASPSSFKGNG